MVSNHYDEQFITKCIEEFQTRMQNSDKRIIYFDSDNTLYKFSTYGKAAESLNMYMSKGFYKNLPIFPEAPDVLENLRLIGFELYILTASAGSPWCEEEKRESIRYYFPMIKEENVIITPLNAKKTKFVEDIEHSILVDDYHVNINQWYKEGGLAIKKSYSGRKRVVPTVQSLIDIFSVLHRFKLL